MMSQITLNVDASLPMLGQRMTAQIESDTSVKEVAVLTSIFRIATAYL